MELISKISVLTIVALLLATVPTTVLAEVEAVPISVVREDLPEVNAVPGSFMYGLNRAMERIQYSFTFNSERKAGLALRNAERRLAESKVMIEVGDNQSAARLMEEYSRGVDESQARLERARAQGRDVEELETHFNERLTKHVEVLARVKETAPNQAQFGLDVAIESSQRNVEETRESIQSRIQERVGDRTQEVPSGPINEIPVDIPLDE